MRVAVLGGGSLEKRMVKGLKALHFCVIDLESSDIPHSLVYAERKSTVRIYLGRM